MPDIDALRNRGAEHIWKAFGGRVAARAPTEVRELLSNVYGANSRGGVNARAAAAGLGVSERTIQRWAKLNKLPSNKNGERAMRVWKESPKVRAARMNPRRESKMRNKGTTLEFKGIIRVSKDLRRRRINIDLTGEETGVVLDSLLAGNDERAHAALEDIFSDAFRGDVELAIQSLSTR